MRRMKSLFMLSTLFHPIIRAQEAVSPGVQNSPKPTPEPATIPMWVYLIATILIGCGVFLCKVWFDAYRIHGTRTFTLPLTDKKMITQKYCLFAGGLILVLSYAATQSGNINAGNLLGATALLSVAAGSVVAEFLR